MVNEDFDPSTPYPHLYQNKENATSSGQTPDMRPHLGKKLVDHGSTANITVSIPGSWPATAYGEDPPSIDTFRDMPQSSCTHNADRSVCLSCSLVERSNITLYSGNMLFPGVSLGSGRAVGSDQSPSTAAAQNNVGPFFGKLSDKELPIQVLSTMLFDKIRKPAATAKQGTPWEDGYIYVLQIPRCPEYVKIGWTRRDPEKRKTELERCGYKLEVKDYEGSYTKVPFCERVEKIIHLDLRNAQHTFICPCKTKKRGSQHDNDGLTEHGEWFKIDSQTAIDTVMKWRDWMHQNPYDVSGNLKLDWRNRISTLARDKTYNSKTIVDEDKAGRRWETFLAGPSVVRDAFFMKRQDSIGRPLDPRWVRMGRNKGQITVFCCVHWAASWFLLEMVGSLLYASVGG